jgi:hypothetical protein
MSNSPTEVAKYEHKFIKCPLCHEEGQLFFRMQHGRRMWCVRHRYTATHYDTYHHIGKYLPIEIKDQIEGRKIKGLDQY